MDISPGTELVWSLAAREAVLTEMAEVEPEHFFCALLKFTELSADELTGLLETPSSQLVDALRSEQAKVVELLAARRIDSRQARRGLRQALGKGGAAPKGSTVHRSPGGRKLFERAARQAAGDGGVLKPQHLLAAVLEQPTAAMAPFLAEVAEVAPRLGPDKEAVPAPPQDWRCRPIAGLDPLAGFQVPEANAPQVRALLLLLKRPQPHHLLLLVEADVPVFDLLGQVDQQLGEGRAIYAADVPALRRRAGEGAALGEQLSALATEYRGQRDTHLFFDLSGLETTPAAEVLRALQGALAQTAPGLVLALPVARAAKGGPPSGPAYDTAPILPPGDVHTVWLHKLPATRHLESV